MKILNKIFKVKDHQDHQDQQEDMPDKEKQQIGLEVKMPGCENFVPLGRAQYNRIFLDDIGPRLLIIVDECAELLEPSGIKTTEGKEEDALKQEITGLMKSITQLGRSSGIHMVIAPLRLSTLIPTTYGYTTMGDVKIGDVVFDKFNKPTKVIGISEIKMSEEMYEITFKRNNNKTIKIGADAVHRFPVFLNSKDIILNTKEIFNLCKSDNEVNVRNAKGNLWKVFSIEHIKNELVRCIEVDSNSHLFIVTDKRYEGWEKNPGEKYVFDWSILTHNTQRNDASIIPGVIQNNPLSVSTKLRIRRKVDL